MGSVNTVGDWLEKQRALSSSRHNLEGALLAEAARTPLKHCCSALDQGTKPLNTRRALRLVPGMYPAFTCMYVAGIGSSTLPENPKRKTAIKEKINEVRVQSIQSM